MNKQIVIKSLLLIFLFLSSISTVNAFSFVSGRIYMKNGSIIECSETDRIRLPKRSGDAIFLRNAYRKMKLRKGSRPTKLTPSLLGIPLHQNTSASLSRPKALAGCRYTSKRSKLVWGFILQKDMESVQMVVSRSYENKGLYFIQKPLFV